MLSGVAATSVPLQHRERSKDETLQIHAVTLQGSNVQVVTLKCGEQLLVRFAACLVRFAMRTFVMRHISGQENVISSIDVISLPSVSVSGFNGGRFWTSMPALPMGPQRPVHQRSTQFSSASRVAVS